MLRFVNGYHSRVAVMIEFYEPACHQPGTVHGSTIYEEPWQKMGWWLIDPGQSAVVYENDLDDVNRYWYFHAFAVDDGSVWAGPYTVAVSHEAFNLCHDAPTGGGRVGMRELDIADNSDYTMTLTP